MSSTHLIYSPNKKEFIKVGSVIGWAVSSYNTNIFLGTLILAALARNGEDGIILITHEDFEFDRDLALSADKTADYQSDDKIMEIIKASTWFEVPEFFVVSQGGDSISVKRDNSDLLPFYENESLLKEIADFAMRNRKILLKLKNNKVK